MFEKTSDWNAYINEIPDKNKAILRSSQHMSVIATDTTIQLEFFVDVATVPAQDKFFIIHRNKQHFQCWNSS